MKLQRPAPRTLVLLGILLGAAALRLSGITAELPFSYYGDEVHFVKRALSFGTGDLNPHWFHKPAFYMYVLFVEYGFYFVVGWLLGWWGGVSEFAVQYVADPGGFYLIGRATTVAFSLLTIWTVYRIGVRHFCAATGILSALLLAVTFGEVEASQRVKADVPAMFFGVLSTYFLLNYLSAPRLRTVLLSAACAGVGAATKFYPFVLILPIFLAVGFVHWTRRRDEGTKLGTCVRDTILVTAIAGGTMWVVFFICSPFNLIDPLGRYWTFFPFTRALDKLVGIFSSAPAAEAIGKPDIGVVAGTVHYFGVIFSREGMGIVVGSIAVLGLVGVFALRERQAWILWCFPAILIVGSIFAYAGYSQPRHQAAMYPYLVVLGSLALTRAASRFRVPTGWVYAVVAAAALVPGYHIAHAVYVKTRPETRNVAKRWIESNIPAGTKILLDENGPQLHPSEASLKKLLDKARKAPEGPFTANYSTYVRYQMVAARTRTTYDLREIRLAWWRPKEPGPGTQHLWSDYDQDMGNPLKPVGVEPYDKYVEEGFRYAIVHSDQFAKFFRPNLTETRPSYVRFYRELFERGALVKEFSSDGGELTGPTVKIFRLGE